jgi:hypothetical protein
MVIGVAEVDDSPRVDGDAVRAVELRAERRAAVAGVAAD